MYIFDQKSTFWRFLGGQKINYIGGHFWCFLGGHFEFFLCFRLGGVHLEAHAGGHFEGPWEGHFGGHFGGHLAKTPFWSLFGPFWSFLTKNV